MDKEKFEKDMEVFSFGQHQDVLTYLSHLKNKGWTIEDTKEWITEQKLKATQALKQALSLNCPECQTSMMLRAVNINKATQTGDDSKSVWLCPNPECMHTIYNKQTLEELSQSSEEV